MDVCALARGKPCKIMEIQPDIAGIPDGIHRILAVLSGQEYKNAVWTLGHKGLYFNFQWPKHVFKFLAKNVVMDKQEQALILDWLLQLVSCNTQQLT